MTRVWFRVIAGDPLLTADPYQGLRRLLDARGHGWDPAIVETLESSGLHCSAVAYLPPHLRAVAVELEGRPVPASRVPARPGSDGSDG